MIRWLRVVLPAEGWLAGFWVLYAFFFTFPLAWAWLWGEPLRYRDRSTPLLIFAAILYAFWRGISFHPIYRAGYQRWLRNTPWTSAKPLPMGPIHLVMQDVAIIGSAAALCWWWGDNGGRYVTQVFLAIYLSLLAISLWGTGDWPWTYAVFFGVGLFVRLWEFLPACLGVAAGTYLVALIGLRQSLARFRSAEAIVFDAQTNDPTRIIRRDRDVDGGTRRDLGWPFGQLAPKFPGSEWCVPLHHAFLSSLILGWLVYSLVAFIPDREKEFLIGIMILLIAVPIIRLGVYCSGFVPPLSLLGRLSHLRLIIPGYDQVFVAPLAAVLMGSLLLTGTLTYRLDPRIMFPVGLAVISFIALGMGPTLKSWRLTGNHRITEGGLRSAAVKVG